MNDSITNKGIDPKTDLVRVKWLRAHTFEEKDIPGFSYIAGDIADISAKHAELLSQCKIKTQNGVVVTEDPYCEILPEGWMPVIEKITTVPESVFVQVKFLEPHPGFGYFKGDIGTVTSKNATMLLKGGFIELIPEIIPKNDGANKGVLGKLKNYLKTVK